MKLRFKNMISIALAAVLAIPTSSSPVVKVAAEGSSEDASVVKLNDDFAWKMDEAYIRGDDAVLEVADGFLHLKAGSQNGNNPGSTPAMFVSTKEFNFDEDGSYEFTFKPVNGGKNLFGIYLAYKDAGNGMYFGYDSAGSNPGWFWQKYVNNDGQWFNGTRPAKPEGDKEVKVRLDWTSDHKANITVGDQQIFSEPIDFSGIYETCGNKIALRCSHYGDHLSEVYIRDRIPEPVDEGEGAGGEAGSEAAGGSEGEPEVPSETVDTPTTSVTTGDMDWVMDPNYVRGKDAVLEVVDGYVHMKSGSQNGNNPGDIPAIFRNTNTFDFSKEGHFDFVLKPKNTTKNRFGILLGYNGAGNGLYFGYDNNSGNPGWFWQKYKGNSGAWYGGTRKASPLSDVDVPVHIAWTNDKKASLTVGDVEVFNDIEFASIFDTMGSSIALKGGSALNEVTEVYVKGFETTTVAPTGTVYSGVVVDQAKKPLSSVLINMNINGEMVSVMSGLDGKFKFASEGQSAQATFVKAGYKVLKKTIALSAGSLDLGEFVVSENVKTQNPVIGDLSVLKEGARDAWVLDPDMKVGNDAINELDGVYRHFKPGSGNGHAPNAKPAVFVHPNEFDFNKPGFISFDLNVKDAKNCRFGVYIAYKNPMNGMFLGFDAGGWFWQKYQNGGGAYTTGGRPAGMPDNDRDIPVEISWTNDKQVTLKVDGKVAYDHFDFSSMENLGNRIGIKCSKHGDAYTDVRLTNIHYVDQALKSTDPFEVTGKVRDQEGNALANKNVTVNGTVVQTDTEGMYRANVTEGTVLVEAAIPGYLIDSVRDYAVAAMQMPDLVLTKQVVAETSKIQSDVMEVEVGTNFPFVASYKLNEKIFEGHRDDYNEITINGTTIVVPKENVTATIANDKAEYDLHVVNAAPAIDVNMKVVMQVVKNELHFDITEITSNNNTVIQTIKFDHHSLVSVNSSQTNANLKGATMSSHVGKPGDEYFAVEKGMQSMKNRDFMYAFVSNNELSAGLWSNSEHTGRAAHTGVAGGSNNTRIFATTSTVVGASGKETSLGLASAPWYYNRVITDTHNKQYVTEATEMPKMKVVIAEDLNGDDAITWQDGAIAFRKIMNNPFKCEEVPELVAWRIAMNFGGQAQNPFLTTLDNVKKVALHTDGLGQSILLKGYGSEGHDSGHPDYGDIGKRIGGAEDMNFLMKNGKDYGARFGVHVNCSEMYPEAKEFKEDLILRSGQNLTYGWNWIDQAVRLDSGYDVGSGDRANRFKALKDQVEDNMDFIYVDVWGNGFSGRYEDAWATRKLSKEINGLGWRLGTEWGSTNEYDSTFQHWATDLTYGGFKMKGENSEVIRFLRNHQKDSWVGDFYSYGSEANCPLLGGYNMMDFEGWQGRNDYDAYILNLYRYDLSTKFLQHYKVTKWEDANTEGVTTFNPTKQITLKDDPFSPKETVVVTRKSTDVTSPDFRHRTMKLNDVVVLEGKLVYGGGANTDKTRHLQNVGDEKYLLPWVWDPVTGERVEDAKKKLYHFNSVAGTSTWTLTDDFKTADKLYMYKLTANGKVEEKEIPVVGGQVTLTAEANTPYVLTKQPSGNVPITWSEKMHIVDAGFNDVESSLTTNWTKEGSGNATISKSQFSNPMLTLDGEVSMTQTLTDLEANQRYVVLVGVDNRSDAKAAMTIKIDGQVVDSNYTKKSIAKNYVKAYTHNTNSATTNGTSYFQHMYTYFTAPSDGKAVTLTLSKEAGEGKAYFDDVRVVKSDLDVIVKNDKGEVTGLNQDFEKSVQGLYPFVVGGIENVEDNRIHLSEKHAPFTQSGWDVKLMDDVLTKNDPSSTWSIKINGLFRRGRIAFQTIPQNFRFEPGKKYRVSFDYQQGSNGTYGVVVGDGEATGREQVTPLEMAMGKGAEKTYTFEITGSESGQTWFGIKSTMTNPDMQGTQKPDGEPSNRTKFGGYLDFVLDNLHIELIEETPEPEEKEPEEKEPEPETGKETGEKEKEPATGTEGTGTGETGTPGETETTTEGGEGEKKPEPGKEGETTEGTETGGKVTDPATGTEGTGTGETGKETIPSEGGESVEKPDAGKTPTEGETTGKETDPTTGAETGGKDPATGTEAGETGKETKPEEGGESGKTPSEGGSTAGTEGTGTDKKPEAGKETGKLAVDEKNYTKHSWTSEKKRDNIVEGLKELKSVSVNLTPEEDAVLKASEQNKKVERKLSVVTDQDEGVKDSEKPKLTDKETKLLESKESGLTDADVKKKPKVLVVEAKILVKVRESDADAGIEYELHRFPRREVFEIDLSDKKEFEKAVNLRVYHVEGTEKDPVLMPVDEELVKHDAKRKVLIVYSEGFSKFVVVGDVKDETPSKVVVVPSQPKKPASKNVSTPVVETKTTIIPRTGDGLHVFGYGVSLVVALGVAFVMLKKRED